MPETTVGALYGEDEFNGILDRAMAQARSGWEEDFIADTRERYRKFGNRMFLSPNQEATLKSISGR